MEPLNPQPTQQQPQQPQQPQSSFSTPPVMQQTPAHKKTGSMIAILAIILVLIIAALYFFSVGSDDQVPQNTAADTTAQSTATVQPVTGTSDDVSTLEADLNASIEGLDEQNF